MASIDDGIPEAFRLMAGDDHASAISIDRLLRVRHLCGLPRDHEDEQRVRTACREERVTISTLQRLLRKLPDEAAWMDTLIQSSYAAEALRAADAAGHDGKDAERSAAAARAAAKELSTDALRHAFDAIDQNGDGRITISELIRAQKLYLGRVNLFEEEKRFQQMDASGSGSVSFREFCDAVRRDTGTGHRIWARLVVKRSGGEHLLPSPRKRSFAVPDGTPDSQVGRAGAAAGHDIEQGGGLHAGGQGAQAPARERFDSDVELELERKLSFNGLSLAEQLAAAAKASEDHEVDGLLSVNKSYQQDGNRESDRQRAPSYEALTKEILTPLLMVLMCNVCIDCMSYSLATPFLPHELADKYGASGPQIGSLFAMFGVGGLAAGPITAICARKFGFRFTIALSAFCLAITFAAFIIPGTTLHALFWARTAQGAASAFTWTAALGLLSRSYSADTIGTANGILSMAMGAGLMLGPPIGGYLYTWDPSYPFVFAIAACVCNMIITVVVLPKNAPDRPPQRQRKGANAAVNSPSARKTAPHTISELATDPVVVGALLATLINAGYVTALEATLPMHWREELDIRADKGGLLFMFMALTAAVMAVPAGALSDRLGPRTVMCVGMALVCGVLPLFALGSNFGAEAATCIFSGIATALQMTPAFPALAERMNDGTTKAADRTVDISAAVNMSYLLGMVVGPAVLSNLVHHYGFQMASHITAIGLGVLTLIMVVMLRPWESLGRRLRQGYQQVV